MQNEPASVPVPRQRSQDREGHRRKPRSAAGLLALALALAFASGCGPLSADDSLGLGEQQAGVLDPDCPPETGCDDYPAAYKVRDPMTGAYGNYDLADRARDGQAIRYIVIHTTEVGWDGTIRIFQDVNRSVSAHYLVRSADGRLAKFLSPTHVGWHAGNWYYNAHSIGIEHEAYSADGHQWFTDALYESSARLVRFLCQKYGIPMDREHIIGHDEVPGLSQARTPAMHWDPGPYWDWGRFLHMVRTGGVTRTAGEYPGDQPDDGRAPAVVRILPDYAFNQPTVSGCWPTGPGGASECKEVPPLPANFVYLRQAPSDGAPAIQNPYFPATPADRMFNWANKAGTGRLFYRVERSGDWDGIYFGGVIGWFKNPGGRLTRLPLPASGRAVITPKTGRVAAAVYGGGYPLPGAFMPPLSPPTLEKVYDLPQGQRYVAYGPVTADYYWAKVWAPTLPMSSHQVVRDATTYWVVSYNHRLALVRSDEVSVVGARGGGVARLAGGDFDGDPPQPQRLLRSGEYPDDAQAFPGTGPRPVGLGVRDAVDKVPTLDLEGLR